MRLFPRTALFIAAAAVSGVASAYEAGDWIVRGGAVMVDPHEDSSAISVAGIGGIAGTGVKVDSDTQAMLTVTYMAAQNIGVELLLSTPFEHTVETRGLAAAGLTDVELGKITHLPPTLSVLWYPLDAGSRLQPFVGAGVNYTAFYDEKVSGEAKNALGASNLRLDNSVGVALRFGVDYLIDDCWSLHAGATWAQISSDARVDITPGTAEVDVDVDPWVYTLGVGYRF